MTKLMTLEESKALEASDKTSHAYWYAALRGEMMPTHPDYVPLGFYRKGMKDGTALPVAVYLDGQGVKFVQTGHYDPEALATPKAEAEFGRNVFAWFASKAISYEAYEHWKAHRAWPEAEGAQALIEASQKARPKRAAKAVAKDDAAPAATPTAAAEPGIGHNSGDDPVILHETFKDQVAAVLSGMKAFTTVDSDKAAGEAQALRSRLNELAGEGDRLRVAEKDPHLKASRAVDEKWQPTIKDAKDGANVLRKAIDSHETAKLRAERERKAKEAADAEAAAAANRVTVTSGADPAPHAAPSHVTPAQSTRIAGAYGRATSAKVRLEIDTIDYRKVCDQFVDTNSELQAVLKKIADRVIAIGGNVNGVTTKEVARIR